jgi:catechol 2,3-dioxygenase-like lactoylglutathione lyase family enzyme
MILAIEHVQLAMPPNQEDSARAFYGELLGLREVPKPAPLAARGGVWFEIGPVRIHLGVEPGFQPSKKAHVAFVVAELDALVREFRRRGQKAELDEQLDGYRRTHVLDPFGNRLELMEARVA